jgi:4-amino-4-deoxy-L-arabinose transferase-like glycosyltransferase
VLAVALFLGPALPRLVDEGMFLDGLLYSVISRNLAEGIGTFWKPCLTPTLTPDYFSDHPPLVFGIQSIFFRVFGDRLFVENLYSLFTAIVTGAMIVLMWRRLTEATPALRPFAWLPVLFWAAIPLVTWSYSNNMLENTLSIFTTGACVALLGGVSSRRRLPHWRVAAVLIAAGLFSKGLVALFPLSLPWLAWWIRRDLSLRAAVGATVLLTVTVTAMVAVVLIDRNAFHNIAHYISTQLAPSLEGARGSVPNRFGVVMKLASELAPVAGVCMLLLVLNRFKGRVPIVSAVTFKAGLLCLAVGATGSLPIALSPRQSGFYLVPSFPLYASGFALIVAPVVARFVEGINLRGRRFRGFAILAAIVLAAVLVYSSTRWGTVGRNATTIHDVKLIATVVPAHDTVTVCESMQRDWSLHGYFYRYYHIALDSGADAHDFAVVKAGPCPRVDTAAMERIPLETASLTLYRSTPP